jgi:hypothetical protein
MLFSMNLAMLKMLSLFSHFGGRTLYVPGKAKNAEDKKNYETKMKI